MSRGFVCPSCLRTDTLTIMRSVDLPPDARSDEISIQALQCHRCEFKGMALYEESKRGALGDEHWSHDGFPLDDISYARLEGLLAKADTNETIKKQLNNLAHQETHGDIIRVDWSKHFPLRQTPAPHLDSTA